MSKKNSSYTSATATKNSKYSVPSISHKPNMSHITYANIVNKVKRYSDYLLIIYKTHYLKNNNNTFSWYKKIEKKLTLTTDNTPKRYNKHLNLLLAILYLASKEGITNGKQFIYFLESIVTLLESSDITGIYHDKTHITQYTYTDINNRFYFMLAKDSLKIIKQKINVINIDFYDKEKLLDSKKYHIIFISNTHVKTLLELIRNSKILSTT